jgi:hypothetical protein
MALLTYEELHQQLGHPHEQVTKQTAKHYKIAYSGKPTPCDNCARAKIKKTNTPKAAEHHATIFGESVCFDISSASTSSQGGNNFGLLILDEFTKYSWSVFLKHRDQLPLVLENWTTKFQKKFNLKVKYFRCDNSGENVIFKNMISHKQIVFELTAPNTPQQNGLCERKFATLYSKVRSLLNHARLDQTFWQRMWAQCARLATLLENILINARDVSPYFMVHGKLPPWEITYMLLEKLLLFMAIWNSKQSYKIAVFPQCLLVSQMIMPKYIPIL